MNEAKDLLLMLTQARQLSRDEGVVGLVAVDFRTGDGTVVMLGKFDPAKLESPEECQKFLRDMMQSIDSMRAEMERLEADQKKGKFSAGPRRNGTVH